ncbi:MAG: hypothetical protein ACYC7J_19625 [Syntrophales bacterium]
MIRFTSPGRNQLNVTFDDRKTDEQKIAQFLVNGGWVVRTSPKRLR